MPCLLLYSGFMKFSLKTSAPYFSEYSLNSYFLWLVVLKFSLNSFKSALSLTSFASLSFSTISSAPFGSLYSVPFMEYMATCMLSLCDAALFIKNLSLGFCVICTSFGATSVPLLSTYFIPSNVSKFDFLATDSAQPLSLKQ